MNIYKGYLQSLLGRFSRIYRPHLIFFGESLMNFIVIIVIYQIHLNMLIYAFSLSRRGSYADFLKENIRTQLIPNIPYVKWWDFE